MTLQGKFEGLFPPLLRLASSQFPHLCLVEDWLTSEPSLRAPIPLAPRSPRVITEDIEAALALVTSCPAANHCRATKVATHRPQSPHRLTVQSATASGPSTTCGRGTHPEVVGIHIAGTS